MGSCVFGRTPARFLRTALVTLGFGQKWRFGAVFLVKAETEPRA